MKYCVIFMQYGRYSTMKGDSALAFEVRTNPYTQDQPYPMNCTLETTMGAMSVLVDYFGTDPERIRVKEIDTPEDSANEKSWTQKVEVTLIHIQYQCLRLFCTQFSHLVVVKSPDRLRRAVQYNLKDTQTLWGPIL